MALPYAKLVAAGTVYVAVDGRGAERDWAALAVARSGPAPGVGSDGLVVVQASDRAQVRMRVFTPDGSEAEMSGNGIRLFAKFVIERKIASPSEDGLVIETGGGIRTVWPNMQGDHVVAARVAMGRPDFAAATIPLNGSLLEADSDTRDLPLRIGDRHLKITCLSLGNPHAVAFPDEPVEQFPLVEIGKQVERHALFPNRTNFEIVNVLSRSRIRARIFERGAGETPSSGTGSTAAATAARVHGFVDDEVEVVLDGGILKISWDDRGEAFLEGPVEGVLEGFWPD
jgi:diaminopimelate epimerase